MKLETDTVYLVDLEDDDTRYVFFEEEKLGKFLMEKIDKPEEKYKKVMRGAEIEGPAIAEVEIPSELTGDEKWGFGSRPFTWYLTPMLDELYGE